MKHVVYKGHTLYYTEPFTEFYKSAKAQRYKNIQLMKVLDGVSQLQFYETHIKKLTSNKVCHQKQLIKYCTSKQYMPDQEGLKNTINKLKTNLQHLSSKKVLGLLISKNLVNLKTESLTVITTSAKAIFLPYINKKIGDNEYSVELPLHDMYKILNNAYRKDPQLKIL